MPRPKSDVDTLTHMHSCQPDFHRQWQHLKNPHVRALAWMLTAPALLDTGALQGQIADKLGADRQALQVWLTELDQQPTALLELLQRHPSRRLGLYAETLFEFYLTSHGLLYARGLQVHDKGASTVGEFDFLLHTRSGLEHWELATKFYLYYPGDGQNLSPGEPDLYDYLGPNLADSLGAKLEKILGQQLQLSRHPLAQTVLPGKVTHARALVLAWLFYRDCCDVPVLEAAWGGQCAQLNSLHCRGAIWTVADLITLDFEQALILERLDWLAPAQAGVGMAADKDHILRVLKAHFANSDAPVMLAMMHENQACMQEYQRGMVVPDDWFARANQLRLKRQDISG